VINALNTAAADWEATARVNFVYLSAQSLTAAARRRRLHPDAQGAT
jgi:hypothetical protein